MEHAAANGEWYAGVAVSGKEATASDRPLQECLGGWWETSAQCFRGDVPLVPVREDHMAWVQSSSLIAWLKGVNCI